MSKKKAKKKDIDPAELFQLRWREVNSSKFDGKKLKPAALFAGLRAVGAVHQIAAPGPGFAGPPFELFATVRRRKGKDCGQVAEIGAFYQGDTRVMGVLGKAAVLALLNAAAAAECCAKGVQCPKECPCAYAPRNAPADYFVAGTVEVGALLQGLQVWNCGCALRPDVEG
jgi:hypothetical protein